MVMPFADELIGVPTALRLTRAIAATLPGTPLTALRAAPERFAALGLRERSDLLRDALLSDIDRGYEDLARVFRSAAVDPGFSGWLIWPVTTAAATRAAADASEQAVQDALALLAELTGRLSSEFAIRTLLRHNLSVAVEAALAWTTSSDADVRRLASEGTRPFLPWATRVPAILQDPAVTIPILDALYRDPSEYVRRSVGNHLNDISRIAPALAVSMARGWLKSPSEDTAAVVRRGMRTLVKRGDADALQLLGFTRGAVDVVGPTLNERDVAVGGDVTFSATITNRSGDRARLAIDYVLHRATASGVSRARTFKLAIRTLEPGESTTVRRTQSLRTLSTRRYDPGAYAIELMVSGASVGRAEFWVGER